MTARFSASERRTGGHKQRIALRCFRPPLQSNGATRILRYSTWDALLVALSLAHPVMLFVAPSVPLIALGVWWNSNTISHNFIHLPFFRSTVWNRAYSLYLSVLLGIPQSLWRSYHLAHHTGKPAPLSFTPVLAFESVAVLALWGFLIANSPRFFWAVYLPGYLAGLSLCYLHGYFEHAEGTTSHHGVLYNLPFFNDGYHVEHHARPGAHWTQLPEIALRNARTSRWPAVLRWMEAVNLERIERIVLRSKLLQNFLLRTHERALRRLMREFSAVRTVTIVGGGIFPRTAILLRRLMPWIEIMIVDASAENIEMSKPFLDGDTKLVNQVFVPDQHSDADLLIIPLAFVGDRNAIYRNPPARVVLVHDWIWSKRAEGVVVSFWLLKRLNLVFGPPHSLP